MDDTFRTIKKTSEGLFKDKGSRFISFAFPVNTEDEIKDILQTIRKEHHSARHHCYAWRLGAEKLLYRANDDGEPSSTAGKPILGQIQFFDLTNILIIVVRYFGGTLLGVSGLINAYRNSALDAINQAEIIEKIVEKWLLIEFDYKALNEVMKIFKEEKIPQIDPKFDLKCKIMTHIRISESNRIADGLLKIESVQVTEIKAC